MKRLSALTLCLVALAASAQEEKKPETTAPASVEETGQTWSVVGARTVAPGANLITGELGYPGISASYQRGIVSGLNLGVRASFIYSIEGQPRDVAPGGKLQALLKFRFFDSGRVSLGVVFEPGFFVASSYLQGTRGGLNLPVGFRFGIAASSALAIGINVDLPMWVEFGSFGGFNLPILTGGGVEYFLTSSFALYAKARVGPVVRTSRPTEVAFDAGLGVAYRFQ